MKIAGVLLLFAVSLSIMPPLHSVGSPSPEGDKALIFTLDVCSKSGQAVSSNTDMPSISETPGICSSPAFAGFHKVCNPSFIPSLISSKKGRPPRF